MPPSNSLGTSQVVEMLCSVRGGSLKRSLGMARFEREERYPQGLSALRLPPSTDPDSRIWDAANSFDGAALPGRT